MDARHQDDPFVSTEMFHAGANRRDLILDEEDLRVDHAPVHVQVLHELPEESWNHVIDINLKGVWLCMKYEITQMLLQGGGAIVNRVKGHIDIVGICTIGLGHFSKERLRAGIYRMSWISGS